MQWFTFIILFVFAAYTHPTAAQQVPDYFKHSITCDNGLSQGSNYFRYEDQRGFMWITANDALNRFDGSYVKVYQAKRYFPDAPILQQGYGFAEDAQHLYVGSEHGLYQYHYEDDQFRLIRIFTNGEAMPIAFLQGEIWCWNKSFQLATFNPSTGKIVLRKQLPLKAYQSIHIYDLGHQLFYFKYPFVDKYQRIWFVHDRHILSYDTHSQKIQLHAVPDLQGNILSAAYDSVLHRLLLGHDKGLSSCDLGSMKWMTLSQRKEVSSITVKDQFIAIRSMEGVFMLKDSNKQWQALIQNKDQFYRYYNFGFDREAKLWICEDGVGQQVYRFAQKHIGRIPTDNGLPSWMLVSGVGTFAELPSGDMSFKFGDCFSVNRKQMYHVPSWNSDTRERFCYDPYRKMTWAYSTLDDQLTLYSLTGISGKPALKPVKNFAFESAKNLQVMPDSGLLLTTGKQLLYYHPESGRTKVHQDLPGGIPFYLSPLHESRFMLSFLQDDSWLIEYHRDSLQFIRKILPGVQSFYACYDSLTQYYWVAGKEGVFLLNQEYEIIRKFNTERGLAGNNIYGLLLDGSGNAWCSHQRGLSQITATDFRIINYNKEDGIQEWDFNNRAFYKSTKGTLYFGGTHGFNFIEDRAAKKPVYQPTLYFNEILIPGKPGRKINAGKSRAIVVEMKENEQEIHIHPLIRDLGLNANPVYYRMDTNNNSWITLNQLAPLRLSGLAPGNHHLQFAYFDKMTGRFDVQASISIIRPWPWFRRPWMMISGALLLSAILFIGLYLLRERSRRRKLQQEQLLQIQRETILNRLHDDLGSSLSGIFVSANVASTLIRRERYEDANERLTKMEIQAKKLADTLRDSIWSIKNGEDAFIHLPEKMRSVAREICEDRNIPYTFQSEWPLSDWMDQIILRQAFLTLVKLITQELIPDLPQQLMCMEFRHDNKIFTLRCSMCKGKPNMEDFTVIKDICTPANIVWQTDVNADGWVYVFEYTQAS